MSWQLAVKERVVEECRGMNERVRGAGGHPIEELEFRTRGQRRRLKALGRWLNGYERPEELKEEWPMMGSFVDGDDPRMLYYSLHRLGNYYPEPVGDRFVVASVGAPGPRVEIPGWWLKWMPAVVSGMEERKGQWTFAGMLAEVYSRDVVEMAMNVRFVIPKMFTESGE